MPGSKKTKNTVPLHFKFNSSVLEIPSDKGFFGWNYYVGHGMMRSLRTNLVPRLSHVGWKKWSSLVRLPDAGNAFGFSSEEYVNALVLHQKRLKSRLNSYFLIALPVVILLVLLPMIAILLLPIYYLTRLTGPEFFLQYSSYLSAGFITFTVIAVLFMLWFELMILKVVFILLDKFYADSLCIQAALGVLVELVDSRVLSNPQSKRFLLIYLDEVARYVRLLPLCFPGTSEGENEAIRRQFRTMETYVRAQVKTAIFPHSGAVEELRKSFMRLTQIFILGTYGDCDWPGVAEEAPVTSGESKKWYQKVLGWTGNMIGLGLPLAGLYFLITRPAVFASLPIATNSLALMAVAWLVLSIDSVLHLGITEKAMSTIKAIKDLI